MGHVLARETAKRDLIAQRVWYVENASPETADRFLGAVEQTLGLLSSQPTAGAKVATCRSEFQSVRQFPVSHGSRDLLRLLD